MRVLHIIPDLMPSRGGPSRSVPELCRALAAAGEGVTLYATGTPGERQTIDAGRAPYAVKVFDAGQGLWPAAFRLYSEIRRNGRQFDLAHVHSLWNPVATLAAAGARSVGLPYVLAPRGMLDGACLARNRALKRAYARVYDHRTVERAARLHFLNRAEAESPRAGWYVYPEHFIAPNGIDLEEIRVSPGSFRSAHPDLKDRHLMLFLGRLHEIKNLDLQLQVLTLLAPKYPRLTWVLIGPDDGEWPRIEAAVRRAGLADRVKWTGSLHGHDRFSALADADVLLQTSSYECHSMAVNEGLAAGVPIVITRSVHFEEVETAGAGFVVDSDPQQLAQAVEFILTDPDKAAAMRTAGRRYATGCLAWPAIAQQVIAAYESVAALQRKTI